MNMEEYKKFVNNKRQMSKIEALAILANTKKEYEENK
jgi:hypothetical protein